MEDFLYFVENESSQIRSNYEFIQDIEYNRKYRASEKEKEKIKIRFDPKTPQKTYNRSIVR